MANHRDYFRCQDAVQDYIQSSRMDIWFDKRPDAANLG
jgi:hypothetical protein